MSKFRINNQTFSIFVQSENTNASSLMGMGIDNNLAYAPIGDVIIWNGKNWTYGPKGSDEINAYGFNPLLSSIALGGITGAVPSVEDRNVALGTYAGSSAITSSTDNVFMGYAAASGATGLSQSVVIGSSAGSLLSTEATGSVFVGYQSGKINTTGFGNTALGTQTLVSNVSGNNLTAVGYKSLKNITSGNNNIGIGSNVGSSLVTGSSNVIIGNNANTSLQNTTDSILIGTNASNTTNSQLIIGSLSNQIDNINIGPNKWFLSPTLDMKSGPNSIFSINLTNNQQAIGCIVYTHVKAFLGATAIASNLSSINISAVNSNGTISVSSYNNGDGLRISAGGADNTILTPSVSSSGTSVIVSMNLSNNSGYEFNCRLNIQNIGVDTLPINLLLP